MKYYCKNCGFTRITQYVSTDQCPACEASKTLVEVPVYETVAQWEARREKKYPDSAPVYSIHPDYTLQSKPRWFLFRYHDAKAQGDRVIIIATEAGKPPDDWRPE